MDDIVESDAELRANLADIALANRAFGGIDPVLRAVRRAGARTVLDVCCGSADIARAIVRDARRRRSPIAVTVLDRSEQILAIARERSGSEPALHFVTGDATCLPFADGAFDMVTCNLALHHFDPEAARGMLAELRRVARLTPLVCDLRRSWLGYAAAVGWSRLASRNRLTRHDAPLSVRRAYTPVEARRLAVAAGWRAPRVRAAPWFRMAMTDSAGASAAGLRE